MGKKGKPTPDLEKGHPNAEAERNHDSDETRRDDNPGDEYSALLNYVGKQGEHNYDECHADEQPMTERVWYMPWKRSMVRDTKEQPVPPSLLETPMLQGLDQQEVNKRRVQFGYNELESEKKNPFLKFLSYFQGPILYVMEIAVLLAAGLRDWVDFGVIIGILALNAFVGGYQEKRAGDIVSQLKKSISLKATVVRNGREEDIEAREVVPGDIMIVEESNTIPADGKILASYDDKDCSKAKAILEKTQGKNKQKEPAGPAGGPKQPEMQGHNSDDSNASTKRDSVDDEDEKGPSILSVDQSAITGESLTVDKYLGDTIFYTTSVKRGKAYVIVTQTAKFSFVGKTASLVTGSREKGHFEGVMTSIGTILLALVIFWIFVVWTGGFFRHVGIATPKRNNLLGYALIFLIIGVPVGLPCVTTTTLAVGAAYLAKHKAIVQKLSAIESLAGVDILCSDKTGTLTANKLSLHEPWMAEGVDVNWMMCVAALASSHNVKSLDPIDHVTITSLKRYPEACEMLKKGWTTLKFSPFDPVSKRITAEVEQDGKRYTCAKGAPNAILKLCTPPENVAEVYKQTSENFALRGFRSLGVAFKEGDGPWQILGLLPMFDPPRCDTAATIGEAQKLGIKVKMLTGDAVAIAKETCRMLNLGTKVYDSQRLIGGELAGSDIHDFVEAADGFAEVFPEHKYQVVKMLQSRGHLTAMTGDGVNDAPSLAIANCGIAVEGASDAARTAADVVFLDPGLATIITAIKVSRQIFHRMKAYIQYRIALCLHLEIYLTLTMLILNETIYVELIVFLAIFADLATIAIAYDSATHAARPVEWQLPKIWLVSVILGALLAAGTWIVRATMFTHHGGTIQNFGSMQEIVFLEVALTENWLIFITRTGNGNGDGWTWPSWQLILAVLGLDVLATIFALFGWFSGPAPHGGWTDIVTIIRVWCYSFGVIVVIAMVYIVLNRWSWLNDLGRKNRSKKNAGMENMFRNLQRLTVVHEVGGEGHPDIFHFQPKKDEKSDDSQDNDSNK
ncbi:plasma-membrane proton-e [Hysterangium stoloniferum]|nr:plasma-membrane proton-e [Hysterangium stoloniferum]